MLGDVGLPSERRPRGPDSKPRRKSDIRLSAEEKILSKFVNDNSLKLKVDERHLVEEILAKSGADVTKKHAPVPILKLLASTNRTAVRNARKRYLNALIYICAACEWIASSEHLGMFTAILFERAGLPPSRKHNLVNLVARDIIDYTDGEDTPVNKRDLSRDVCAVRWLMKEGIRSFEIREYQASHGGGADEWHRAWSASQKKEIESPQENEEEPRQDYFADCYGDLDVEPAPDLPDGHGKLVLLVGRSDGQPEVLHELVLGRIPSAPGIKAHFVKRIFKEARQLTHVSDPTSQKKRLAKSKGSPRWSAVGRLLKNRNIENA